MLCKVSDSSASHRLNVLGHKWAIESPSAESCIHSILQIWCADNVYSVILCPVGQERLYRANHTIPLCYRLPGESIGKQSDVKMYSPIC